MVFDGSVTVGVAICTFGDAKWRDRAYQALESVKSQTRPADTIILQHGRTLAESRNMAILSLQSRDWIILLDADDELDREYIAQSLVGTGDIRAPRTQKRESQPNPVRLSPGNILFMNWVVIGAMFRPHWALLVGGFRELGGLEDWDLWARMTIRGATIGESEGIYYIHESTSGRNKSDAATAAYSEIALYLHNLSYENDN